VRPRSGTSDNRGVVDDRSKRCATTIGVSSWTPGCSSAQPPPTGTCAGPGIRPRPRPLEVPISLAPEGSPVSACGSEPDPGPPRHHKPAARFWLAGLLLAAPGFVAALAFEDPVVTLICGPRWGGAGVGLSEPAVDRVSIAGVGLAEVRTGDTVSPGGGSP
jgi:hypothetical protein